MSGMESVELRVNALIPHRELISIEQFAKERRKPTQTILEKSANIGLAGFDLDEGDAFGLTLNKKRWTSIEVSKPGRKKIDDLTGIYHLESPQDDLDNIPLIVNSQLNQKVNREAVLRRVSSELLYGEIIQTGFRIIRACQIDGIELYLKTSGVLERLIIQI